MADAEKPRPDGYDGRLDQLIEFLWGRGYSARRHGDFVEVEGLTFDAHKLAAWVYRHG